MRKINKRSNMIRAASSGSTAREEERYSGVDVRDGWGRVWAAQGSRHSRMKAHHEGRR